MTAIATRQMAVIEALAAGGCHTTKALVDAVDLRRTEVSDTCCRLVRRGYVVRRSKGCFEMTGEGRQAFESGEILKCGAKGPRRLNTPIRPRRETHRDRIWRAIRIQRKFSVASIAEVTDTTSDHVGHYVRLLARAGYLLELAPEPANGRRGDPCKRWTLLDDTGFRAPSLVRREGGRRVFDRNLGVLRAWV